MRQASLFPELKRTAEWGGSLLKGKRKGKRPIAVKSPLHLVLRVSPAQPSLLTPNHRRFIEALLRELGKRFAVKVYARAIVSNHLHLGVLAKNREGFKGFLRVLNSKIALHMTGAKKGKALTKQFFEVPVYSRIVEWGRDWRGVLSYIEKNTLEALELIAYTPRKTRCPPNPSS